MTDEPRDDGPLLSDDVLAEIVREAKGYHPSSTVLIGKYDAAMVRLSMLKALEWAEQVCVERWGATTTIEAKIKELRDD